MRPAQPGGCSHYTALNLRNANGTDFNPATYASYNSWVLGASATNMAYMLSAQLSAMYNNVNVRPNTFGGVNGAALIYAPGASGASSLGFMSVNALIAEANASLATNAVTTSSGAVRDY